MITDIEIEHTAAAIDRLLRWHEVQAALKERQKFERRIRRSKKTETQEEVPTCPAS